MADIQITEAGVEQLPLIQSIAYRTWPVTFANILSEGQIRYMLAMMYAMSTLQEHLDDGFVFLLAGTEAEYLGFACYELDYQKLPQAQLHKLYVLPEAQGKGVGRALIETVAGRALAHGNPMLLLNVNRFNPAVAFYRHIGFSILKEQDIEIGNGYLMQDYVMEKKLLAV